MGTFNYDNQYTRAADVTTVFPAQQIGLSLAAFMLGLPSSVSIADENGFDVRNHYFGTFAQDTWRVTRNLTVNLGLRVEWENGIREMQNRAMLWFDPNAPVSISAAARAAYAASPDPALPVSQFNVIGGSVYAGTEGKPDRTWKPETLLMPRLSFGYKLGEKNVIKGGYGMYYDTINARDWTPNQDGYDVTTTNQLSNDFGQTFALGDPRNGILPLVDPFPVRATGSRYELVPGNALGVDNVLGRGFTAENPNRVHSRVQRWRLGWQRELDTLDGDRGRLRRFVCRSSRDVDPPGLPARTVLDRRQRPRHLDGRVPHRERDESVLYRDHRGALTLLRLLAGGDPLLAQRLAGSTTFTSPTIQRQRLLRAVPAHERPELQRPAARHHQGPLASGAA